MCRLFAFLTPLFVVVGPSFGALVWSSTFDSSADGVVDVRDDNPNKVMIGANTGGRQDITTAGRTVTPSDKAGRPVGGSLTASSSFGAYYKWHYSAYESSDSEEVAGFVSPASTHSTRQFMGAAFIHYKSGSNYFLRFGARWASDGYTGSGRKFTGTGADLNLGTNPLNQELQVAIGYDGPTKILTTALYDNSGNLIKMVSGDIRTFDNLGVPVNDPALVNEVNALSLSNLGWSDFISGALSDKVQTWSTDTMNYYNDSESAFLAIVPEPATASLLLAGLAAMSLRGRKRLH